MLLTDNNETRVFNTDKKVVVISPRESLQTELAQLLRLESIESVEMIKQSIYGEGISLSVDEVDGVIIDMESMTDVNEIIGRIGTVVPQSVWCCVVGNSDSISLAQALLERNVLYFNSESQIHLMIKRIVSDEMTIPTVRNTARICIMGCKGGAGASFLASQIADRIAKYKKVPVLLAQGDKGSRDLDLLFDHKLKGEVAQFKPYLDLFDGDYRILSARDISKYNFVIYDQPVFNVSPDDYVDFFDVANAFVLVVDRNVISLRVAKRFLDQVERVKTKEGQLIRVFVCVIDSRLEYTYLMSRGDVESLLKAPVDMLFPFLKKFDAKTILDVKLSKQNKKVLNDLTMKVIGATSRQLKAKEQVNILKLIWDKILEV